MRPGQIYLGKFRIEKIIGEGAMGMVAEATHLALEERVALKFLRRSALARPDIVARFAREARAAAKIKSDHVARVYDVGEDGQQPYIVMEHLEGKDLEALIIESGPPPISDSVEWVIQACEGLASAHAHGIIHRDIKPANLFMVERSGMRQIKLLDFGISKAGLSGADGSTSGTNFLEVDVGAATTTQIMGSPHYMSPEQIRSTKDVDARADVWSIGVVLYELLTGKTPFDGSEITGIIARVLHEPHRPLSSHRADLPPGLEAVVDRCLSKELTTRFQTPADLAVALLPFAPKRARGVVDRATAVTVRASGIAFASPDSLPPPRRSMVTSKAPVVGREAAEVEPTAASTPVLVTPAEEAAFSTTKESRPLLFWLAILAILLGLAGGLYAIVARVTTARTTAEAPTPTPRAPTTATATAPTTTTPPTPTSVTASTTPPATEATTRATSPMAQPALPMRPWQPAAAAPATTSPAPQTTTTPVSTTKDSEIRLER